MKAKIINTFRRFILQGKSKIFAVELGNRGEPPLNIPLEQPVRVFRFFRRCEFFFDHFYPIQKKNRLVILIPRSPIFREKSSILIQYPYRILFNHASVARMIHGNAYMCDNILFSIVRSFDGVSCDSSILDDSLVDSFESCFD